MAEYTFSRAISPATGAYDVPNVLRTDDLGDRKTLSQDFSEKLPGINATIHCEGTEIRVLTDIDLDAAQQAALSEAIEDNRNNVHV